MADDPYGAIARKYPLPAEQRFFALEDENKRLREALTPFAAWEGCYCEPYWLEDYGRHGPNCQRDDYQYEIEAARSALGVTDD